MVYREEESGGEGEDGSCRRLGHSTTYQDQDALSTKLSAHHVVSLDASEVPNPVCFHFTAASKHLFLSTPPLSITLLYPNLY